MIHRRLGRAIRTIEAARAELFDEMLRQAERRPRASGVATWNLRRAAVGTIPKPECQRAAAPSAFDGARFGHAQR